MKNKYSFFLVLFTSILLFSCGDDILSLQSRVENYHEEEWGISHDIIYCSLEPTKTSHLYEGTLNILIDTDIWRIPIAVKREGDNFSISYKQFPNADINSMRKEYEQRVKMAYDTQPYGNQTQTRGKGFNSIDDCKWLVGKWYGTNKGTYGNSYWVITIHDSGYFEQRTNQGRNQSHEMRIVFDGSDKVKMGGFYYRLDSDNQGFYLLSEDGTDKEKYVKSR